MWKVAVLSFALGSIFAVGADKTLDKGREIAWRSRITRAQVAAHCFDELIHSKKKANWKVQFVKRCHEPLTILDSEEFVAALGADARRLLCSSGAQSRACRLAE